MLYASVAALSTTTVYVPAFVISYSPVTSSPFTFMVKAPSVSFSTVIVMMSPISAVIGVMFNTASFLFASNTLVTVWAV